MEIMCYSKQYYNQLKRKQYDEYLKNQKNYFLYIQKYYEEYGKKQNKYFLDKKKYDKEHHKRNNDEFLEGRHDTVAKEALYKETKHKKVKKIDKNEYNNTHKNQVNKCTIESCKTTVSSETLPLCENIPHTSDAAVGPVTVKIPVVLTECKITINVQSSLKLEDTLLEIKNIRKNAYLNQCKLILNSENDKPNTGILFLAGFIRKNIEYSTKDHNDKGILNGKLKHVTVKVPFKCTTRVTFNNPPKFKRTTLQDEIEILQTNIEIRNSCGEEITGRDIREKSFRLIEFFNEKVFCELISAEFVESDILENPTNKECKSPLEHTFHQITEKVVLFLTIELLQKQNVIIPR